MDFILTIEGRGDDINTVIEFQSPQEIKNLLLTLKESFGCRGKVLSYRSLSIGGVHSKESIRSMLKN